MPTVLDFNRLKETVLPEWTKPENASVFDPAYRAPVRALIKMLGLDDPQQVMALGTPLETGSMAGGAVEAIAKRFPRFAEALKVYHGSPHDFERFDASKIGTGEGAQAYGHGLYFAENPAVAGSYKDSVQSKAFYKGNPILNVPTSQQATYAKAKELGISFPDAAKLVDHDRLNVLSYAQSYGKDAKRFLKDENQRRLLDAMVQSGELVFPEGKMYEVAIHADPEHFLDWDKPLSQQSEHVQKAMEGLDLKWVKDERPFSPGKYSLMSGDKRLLWRDKPGDVRGSDLYSLVGAKTAKEASEKLKSLGIAGIRYLDQGSRASGAGSRNFVVFPGNEHLIDILKKYGIAATTGIGVGSALAQGSEVK